MEKKWYSDQQWNSGKCRCECNKHNICEKDYIWNPATCTSENGKYLASIMNDVVMCDKIIESYDEEADSKSYDETKTILTKLMKRE